MEFACVMVFTLASSYVYYVIVYNIYYFFFL